MPPDPTHLLADLARRIESAIDALERITSRQQRLDDGARELAETVAGMRAALEHVERRLPAVETLARRSGWL